MPRTKAIGRIAAITAKVARIVGLPTSSTASTATSDNERPLTLGQSKVAHYVLDNHDCVIDEYANGENERKQRDAVQRVAVEIENNQRERQRHRHGQQDNARLTPSQRQRHQQRHRKGGEEQVLEQFV